jgi:hypothetical protein
MTPGGPARSQEQWAALVRGWFPELVDTRLRQVTWPDIDKHRDYVMEQLKADVTAATIHQRLRDEHGLQAASHRQSHRCAARGRRRCTRRRFDDPPSTRPRPAAGSRLTRARG